MESERKFVIDIGTNSIRLLEAETSPRGIRTVSKQINTVRIGEGVDKNHRLNPAAIERGIGAIRKFQDSIAGRGEVFAFATSAVRDAQNGREFLERVRAEAGISIELLSGEEEAACGARGALMGKDGAVVDIGGGSTEVAVMRGESIVFAESVDIGCVRGYELFPGEAHEAARGWAKRHLSQMDYPGAKQVYAIGGTATALAAAELGLFKYDPAAVQGYVLTKEAMEALLTRLSSMSIEERMRTMCMDDRRAEVVVYGLVILLAFMDCFSIFQVIASEYDNLEGYLLKKLEK